VKLTGGNHPQPIVEHVYHCGDVLAAACIAAGKQRGDLRPQNHVAVRNDGEDPGDVSHSHWLFIEGIIRPEYDASRMQHRDDPPVQGTQDTGVAQVHAGDAPALWRGLPIDQRPGVDRSVLEG